jgi:TrpR-related protein YerC/YecD
MAAADTWRTDETTELFNAILRLDTVEEAERFFRDLCTLGELRDMAQRWAVARMLDEGLHYARISQETGASTATITRIASWLRHGEGGYRLMLDRLTPAGRSPGASVAPAPAGSRAETRR